MKNYPSDIPPEQFQTIAPLLEAARKKTKPRTVDLAHVFNALLYVVKTGCQWRALPKEYPKWRSVHSYFQIWSRPRPFEATTVLATVLKKIGGENAYKRWQSTQDHLHHR